MVPTIMIVYYTIIMDFLKKVNPQTPIKIAVWSNNHDGKQSLGFQLTQEKED